MKENFTTDTALVESTLWIPGALLYLPVGILAAIILLEIVDLVQKNRGNDRAALVLLIFGLIVTFSAAHLGWLMAFFLGDWSNFPFQRLAPGYLLGFLFLACWGVKYLSLYSLRRATELSEGHRKTKQRTSGNPIFNAAYRVLLVLTLIVATTCLSYKADFGEVPAYVTLGFHGKAADLPKPPPVVPEAPPPVPVAPAPPTTPAVSAPVMVEPVAKAASEPEPTSEPQPQPMPVAAAPAAPMPDNLTVSFTDQVEPILDRSCYDCHGANEDKGDLRLHSPAAIRHGTGDDPVIVAGKPKESPLYYLTTLTPDDDDIMPSKGDPLTKEETEILRVWVLEGAWLADGRRFDDAPAPADSSDTADGGGDGGMPLSTQIVIPNPDYLKTLTAKGIIVTEAAAEHMLEIDYSKANLVAGDFDLTVLHPLARNIISLDLSKSKVSDEDLEAITELDNLVTLRLDRTNTGDAALSIASDLPKLEILTLFATRITDSGISQLGSLKNLKEVVLYNTLVTAGGANRLRQSLPNAEIQAPE